MSIVKTDFPLDDRWEVATKAPWAFKHTCFTDNIVETLFPEASLYDDFNCDRHQTLVLISDDFMDMVWNHMSEAKDVSEDFEKTFDEVVAPNIKEKLLQNGIYSMVYDW